MTSYAVNVSAPANRGARIAAQGGAGDGAAAHECGVQRHDPSGSESLLRPLGLRADAVQPPHPVHQLPGPMHDPDLQPRGSADPHARQERRGHVGAGVGHPDPAGPAGGQRRGTSITSRRRDRPRCAAVSWCSWKKNASTISERNVAMFASRIPIAARRVRPLLVAALAAVLGVAAAIPAARAGSSERQGTGGATELLIPVGARGVTHWTRLRRNRLGRRRALLEPGRPRPSRGHGGALQSHAVLRGHEAQLRRRRVPRRQPRRARIRRQGRSPRATSSSRPSRRRTAPARS